ncbi:hypothetical protein MMC29_004992 [Sticta canariensis]|nr:hypothetical protein [Sticta canariensis]
MEIGFGVNLPFTAVQVLNENDISMGNGTYRNEDSCYRAVFSKLGGAIAIPLGNTILIDGLRREVSALMGNISPQSVVKVGPTNLKALTNDTTTLHSLRLSYSKAVTNTLYYALGAIAITLPFAMGMEWKNLEDSSQHEANDKDAKSQLPGALHLCPYIA